MWTSGPESPLRQLKSLEKGPVPPPVPSSRLQCDVNDRRWRRGRRLTSCTVTRASAIFDLDRTVLRGPSGPAISEALAELGLRRANFAGESLLYRSYELLGENLFGIAIARAAALGVKGWSVDRMRAAGRRAAELLAPQVGSYVPSLLADHRRAGHVLVLATTTPDVLIRPLAQNLGFDEVIATRYAWRDGAYTGALEGGFVWGLGKLHAVRRWAGSQGVELKDSFAYSDSAYDLPLLSAVGHPAATNPDPRLHAIALLRRWPVMHLDSPPGVVSLCGAEVFDLAKHLVRPELFPYARFDLHGIDRIPDTGPFLLVSNHRSYFDVAAISLIVAAQGSAHEVPWQEGALRRAGRGPDRTCARRHCRRAPRCGGRLPGRRPTGAGSRRRPRHTASGHDPARPFLLRPRFPRQDGRRPARGTNRRTGHPGRALEDRSRVAALLEDAEHHKAAVPAEGEGTRRAAGRKPRPQARGRTA